MKRFTVTAAIIGLILGVLGMVSYANTHNGFSTNTIDETKTIKINEIHNIQLESSLTSINFYPTDSEKMTIHFHGGTSRKNIAFDAKVNGETVLIEVRDKNNRMFNLFPFEAMGNHLKLDVAIPEKEYNQIKVHSSAGNIKMKQITANQFDLHSSAGGINIEKLKGNMKVHASAGSMKLIYPEGELDLTDSAGSIDVLLKSISYNIKAKSSAGSVRIVTEEEPSKLQMNLSTSAGSAEVNLPGAAYTTMYSDHLIGSIGTGGPLLQLESSAGSVSIKKK